MFAENQPLWAGSKRSTGAIGTCQVCMNKAELHNLVDDDRNMCEDCAKAIFTGRQQKKEYNGQVDIKPACNSPTMQAVLSLSERDEEKELYLYTIRGKVSKEQVNQVVLELVDKQVFHYDFSRILENPRWFSLMDLRRLALLVDPNFEKPQANAKKDPTQADVLPMKSKPKKGSKHG